jgi:predicted nucleic-acid-binding Zn-ribbon protein
MQVVHARCAGLDVHKKTVSACISVCEVNGVKHQQTRAFGTFTQDLLKLADWRVMALACDQCGSGPLSM